jgi:uncharacterized protein YcnI
MRLRTIAPLAALLALIAVPAAAAHVTMNPDAVPADSFARFSIRVPNERENADTVKLSVQLPPGVLFVSFQPKAGWTRTTTTAKLDTPVTVEGEQVTDRIATVTWSGGKIAPGEFDEFGMSAKVPNSPGKTLVFPAVQTYSNGEAVHWIAPQTADEPAPHVTLEAAAPEEPQATAAPAANSDDNDGGSDRDTLTLVLAIAGVALGVVALGLAAARRRHA